MRVLLVLCLVFLAGCVSLPFAASQSTDQPMAQLTMVSRSTYPSMPKYDGIWSVDGHDIPNGPVQSVFVAPGKRDIGYLCPGWISMDGFPSLSHTVVAGKHYEINCEKEPYIRMVPAGA